MKPRNKYTAKKIWKQKQYKKFKQINKVKLQQIKYNPKMNLVNKMHIYLYLNKK